jgi:predicted ester cyclase
MSTLEQTASPDNMKQLAAQFFDACESGRGWETCSRYCHPDATFSAQADALAGVDSVQAYTDWMKGFLTLVSDAGYEIRSFGVDAARGNVAVYATLSATHTEEGGPVPPTGKRVEADYVYVMEFDGDRIRHMTKIWNDVKSLQQLGWA